MIMNLRFSLINAMYLSLEKLMLTINHHVESKDYAVVKQRFKKNLKTNQVVKIYLRCDREEKLNDKSHEKKRKHSLTRLVNCFFFLFCLEQS
jgi:hypothetical protein